MKPRIPPSLPVIPCTQVLVFFLPLEPIPAHVQVMERFYWN